MSGTVVFDTDYGESTAAGVLPSAPPSARVEDEGEGGVGNEVPPTAPAAAAGAGEEDVVLGNGEEPFLSDRPSDMCSGSEGEDLATHQQDIPAAGVLPPELPSPSSQSLLPLLPAQEREPAPEPVGAEPELRLTSEPALEGAPNSEEDSPPGPMETDASKYGRSMSISVSAQDPLRLLAVPRPPEGNPPASSAGGTPRSWGEIRGGTGEGSQTMGSTDTSMRSETRGSPPTPPRPKLTSRGGIMSTGDDGLNLPGFPSPPPTKRAAPVRDPSSKMAAVAQWMVREEEYLARGAPPEDRSARMSLQPGHVFHSEIANNLRFSLGSPLSLEVGASRVNSMAAAAVAAATEAEAAKARGAATGAAARAAAAASAAAMVTRVELVTMEAASKRHASNDNGDDGDGVISAEHQIDLANRSLVEVALVDVVADSAKFNSESNALSNKQVVHPIPTLKPHTSSMKQAVLLMSGGLSPQHHRGGGRLTRALISMGGADMKDQKKGKRGTGILKHRDGNEDVRQRAKHRKKVHFTIAKAAKNGKTFWQILLAFGVHPAVNERINWLHLMMLTYESWAIPFRLALQDRYYYADVAMDVIAMLSLMHALMIAVNSDIQRAFAMRRRGITLFPAFRDVDNGGEDKMEVSNYLASIGAKISDKQKKKMQKKQLKDKREEKEPRAITGEPLYAAATVAQLRKSPYAVLVCGSLYASELCRVWAHKQAMMVFFLSAIVRCSRMVELGNYIRKKEMDLHANMRRVAFLKFFIMVFGLSHLTGCLSYFLARIGHFSTRHMSVTWVAQYEIYNPSYDYDYKDHLSLLHSAKVYLLIVYTGFNGLTNMGYHP